MSDKKTDTLCGEVAAVTKEINTMSATLRTVSKEAAEKVKKAGAARHIHKTPTILAQERVKA